MSTSSISRPCPLFASLKASQAANQGIEQARYAVFATITPQGQPSCRTIVIRSLHEQSIVACTDARSSKLQELGSQSVAELCWWFPQTKEQYRLLSRVQVVDANACDDQALIALRSSTWAAMSPSARAQFNMAAPGTLMSAVKTTGDLDKYEAQPPSIESISVNFALLVMFPFRIDYVFLVKPTVSPHPIPLESFAKECGQQVETRHEKSQGRWIGERELSSASWSVMEVQP